MNLTIRNWVIGWYVAEYEQRGEDRARYGDGLMDRLASRLTEAGVSRAEARELRRYRQFYVTYPQIRESLTPELRGTVLPATLPGTAPIREAPAPESQTPADELLTRLSFTHIAELLKIESSVVRTFYEAECLRGGWSVRELRRQIGSLFFERSGLSTDKPRLSVLTHRGADPAPTVLDIRDPYVFEFLGLKPAEVMTESASRGSSLNGCVSSCWNWATGFVSRPVRNGC